MLRSVVLTLMFDVDVVFSPVLLMRIIFIVLTVLYLRSVATGLINDE